MPKIANYFKLKELTGMNRQLWWAMMPLSPVQLTLFDFSLKFYFSESIFAIPIDSYIW